MILGTAAKMFTIAGPVIVYGVSASVVGVTASQKAQPRNPQLCNFHDFAF